jgi:hypothetical protein
VQVVQNPALATIRIRVFVGVEFERQKVETQTEEHLFERRSAFTPTISHICIPV